MEVQGVRLPKPWKQTRFEHVSRVQVPSTYEDVRPPKQGLRPSPPLDYNILIEEIMEQQRVVTLVLVDSVVLLEGTLVLVGREWMVEYPPIVETESYSFAFQSFGFSAGQATAAMKQFQYWITGIRAT